jgi:hypothetical protein
MLIIYVYYLGLTGCEPVFISKKLFETGCSGPGCGFWEFPNLDNRFRFRFSKFGPKTGLNRTLKHYVWSFNNHLNLNVQWRWGRRRWWAGHVKPPPRCVKPPRHVKSTKTAAGAAGARDASPGTVFFSSFYLILLTIIFIDCTYHRHHHHFSPTTTHHRPATQPHACHMQTRRRQT